MSSIKIIVDNAGGTTLQLSTDSQEFAAYYVDQALAADNVIEFLAAEDLSAWEGHDEDAASLNPTREQIANGGYRVYIASGDDILDEMREAVTQMEQSSWGNAQEFAARMREDTAFARIEA